MSAGLDTIALAVAHLERSESLAAESPVKAGASPTHTAEQKAHKEDDNHQEAETFAASSSSATNTNVTSQASRNNSPRASPPPMVTSVPRHHSFHHANARMVSADHSGVAVARQSPHPQPHPHPHAHHHHPYMYMHHPHAHHQPHHAMASAPRSSPMTVYAAHHPHAHHHMQQGPHHHLPPHHGHYVYAPMPSSTEVNTTPATASPSPLPPPPEEPAAANETASTSSSQSGSPEPPAVFDMDELDRLLTAAIQTDIHATPPPEVPKDEAIPSILTNDVLCGRGGETNHHAGNIRYRQLVKICQPAYIAAKRREKPKIAQRIVRAVRLLGGRFLKKVPDDNNWRDVGNVKAREKTSQALREGAPELRSGKDDELPKSKRKASKLSEPARPPQPKYDVILPPHCRPAPAWEIEYHRRKMGENHQPFSVVAPPAGMGSLSYQAMPPQQPEHEEQAHKRRRLSTDHQASPSTVVATPTANGRNTTPTAFTATVSADDDDGISRASSSNASQVSPQTPGRGPRLKLLKRRLQASA